MNHKHDKPKETHTNAYNIQMSKNKGREKS